MTDKRNEVLASVGLRKAPELVSVKGMVSAPVAEALKAMASEAGVTEAEVVGLAVADWIKKVQKKLQAADKAPQSVQE